MSGLILGLIVAVASGIAVVLGISKGGVSAIVGVAISASLLPPIVNSGLCLSFALYIFCCHGATHDVHHYLIKSGVSFQSFPCSVYFTFHFLHRFQ